jgi:hypothetical protein
MKKTIDSNAKNLYKEMFLKYIRLAKFNNDLYVKTECRPQMKRAVTYKVDIAIDEHGSIYECQCECAVGMGPNAHCKHVCCLLFGPSQFFNQW